MSNLLPETERELADYISQFYDNPFGLVMAVFPFGEPTLPNGDPNILAESKGPEAWQKEVLDSLGAHIKMNVERAKLGLALKIWRCAIASGHGVGKSALVAWLIFFFMTTRFNTRGVVTAATQFQLDDKTMPELGKWHDLAINKHWFERTATTFSFALGPEESRKNYMTTAATVSEHKTEAFAGLHNEGRTVFVIFDEASGVFSKVWEVATGALTDGEAFFIATGNPTKADGEFADCFDKHKDMYQTWNVDSRTVSHVNEEAVNDIIKLYGADSDAARIRVYGQFPVLSYNGFLSHDVVREAQARELLSDSEAPLIMAIDVARFGDDSTVIGFRQGRDARSFEPRVFKGLDNVKVAEIAGDMALRADPDAIVIESTGPGTGVIDIMRDRKFRIAEVHPGAASSQPDLFVNRRAEFWHRMRDWLTLEGCINEDPELFRQLTSIQFSYDRHEQRTKMEAKADMKKRGLPSPDKADMLALTFAVRLPRRDSRLMKPGHRDKAILHTDPLAF